MKKLTPFILTLLLLAGCAAEEPAPPVEEAPAETPPTVHTADPWQDFETADAMAAFVGFTFDVPDKTQDAGALTAYRAMENMGEVRYESGLILRKSAGTGDISGDYKEYSETNTASTLDESGTVEMMGNDGLIYKAIWEMGGYTYSATTGEGMAVHTMAQLVMQIQ